MAVDLATVLSVVVTGVSFRSLPFMVYGLCSGRVGALGKLFALFAIASLIYAASRVCREPRELLADIVVAWVWLTMASTIAYFAVGWFRRVNPTNASLLLSASLLFLLLPGVLVRNTATLYLLATGFDRTFAAHSYWKELSSPRARQASLRECLVFLLVNPTLVFPARGREVSMPQWSLRAASRVGLGVAGMFLPPLLLMVIYKYSPLASRWAEARGLGYVSLIACGVVVSHMWVQYFAHSSLAHFQIGAMRLFGYEVPERYNLPFLARSPDELWRRWNIYLGVWLQRYVYLPLATRYQRRLRPELWSLAKGFALVLTFGLCGLMHEAAGYALRFQLPLGAVLAFTFYGLVLAAWTALRQSAVRLSRALSARPKRASERLGGVLSWGVSIGLLIAFGMLVLPGLGGEGLPPVLAHWLLR